MTEKKMKRIDELMKQFHQINNKGKNDVSDLGSYEGACRGYIRVSTLKQVESHLSLDVQTKQIEDFCKKNNYKLIKIYVDGGISGKEFSNRQAYKDLISDLLPGEFVAVPSLSRLGRNTAQVILEVENIKKKGGYLKILDMNIDLNSEMGSMMLEFMSMMNSQERKQISSRTRVAMTGLIENGKIRTKPRFGWKVKVDEITKEKELIEDPAEQIVIETIREILKENPDATVAEVVRTLEFGNIKIKKSNKIHHQTVGNIIRDNDLRPKI